MFNTRKSHNSSSSGRNAMSSFGSILQEFSALSTGRKHNLPDKTVASQVLMYRQLLHTECKPGLRLSREYQGTEAQKAVKHMPWWEQGVESTKRMVISYDNLIVRLWLNGAIMPYVHGGYAAAHSKITLPKDDVDYNHITETITETETETISEPETENINHDSYNLKESNPDNSKIDTLIDSNGLPPIPHPYWVDRLGFQQTDPVTDFRSGGVLSLAMIVHLIESCPAVHARFLPSGDAHMLPYGITCINITDMIAKFCMFSKSIDRVDALLSQKPFWQMFTDPNALLVLQELSVDMLCDVVVELQYERLCNRQQLLDPHNHDYNDNDNNINTNTTSNSKQTKLKSKAKSKSTFEGQDTQEVSVFDFAEILSRTEQRVEHDLLGAGPSTVQELRDIHAKISLKYKKQRINNNSKSSSSSITTTNHDAKGFSKLKHIRNHHRNQNNNENKTTNKPSVKQSLKATLAMTENVMDSAGDVWNKYKGKINFRPNSKGLKPPPPPQQQQQQQQPTTQNMEEIDFTSPSDNNNNIEDDTNNNHNHFKSTIPPPSQSQQPPQHDPSPTIVKLPQYTNNNDNYNDNDNTPFDNPDDAFTIGDDDDDDIDENIFG
eukprot:CAMPEP_0184860810 /NCGR_PEP_ID=MMETSP0580-20130426/5616_1 /TAXON_ID=1118495 /ORGANISM="Dactyliosolen fragilissimus" /LENGTH=605 /DNA_ID=CAMNT_0027358051 /DNA_START=89 /DNA_END=1906 /DNA_ORIENTATION=-